MEDSTTVDVTTIDVLTEARPIGILKIDVEGFELDVLKGAAQRLNSGAIQFVYAELIDLALINAGTSAVIVEAFLRQRNLFPVVWDGQFRKASLAKSLEASGEDRSALFMRQ